MTNAAGGRTVAVIATVLALAGPAHAADPPAAQQASIAAPMPVSCPSGTQSSREYAFNLMGNRAGYQTVCLQAGGTRLVHFAFNDRGRGPVLKSKIVVDARGIPVAITNDGNDFYKGPVAERFMARFHAYFQRGGG